MGGMRTDRLLWLTSLLFVVWLIWVETSFQYFERALGADLRLPGRGGLLQ